jgi:putative oxidoreductase
MSSSTYAARPATNSFARFTTAAFGLFPMSITMLVLRFTLAIPFWKSGLTRWDDWFVLSFGTKIGFETDLKLHIFGAEYPYPFPDLMAYGAACCEIAFPILLVFGLFTRYVALGLLGMTAIIELTFPDAWQTYHLPWAAMALAILTFGPGRLALDWALGLDRQSRP